MNHLCQEYVLLVVRLMEIINVIKKNSEKCASKLYETGTQTSGSRMGRGEASVHGNYMASEKAEAKHRR